MKKFPLFSRAPKPLLILILFSELMDVLKMLIKLGKSPSLIQKIIFNFFIQDPSKMVFIK